jgi:hypothetical protein
MTMKRTVLAMVVAVSAAVSGSTLLGQPAPATQAAAKFDGVETIGFQRSADDVLFNLNKYGTPGKTLNGTDQLRLDFFSSNWDGVAKALKAIPADQAAKVYDKMLADLTAKGEPFMLLDDVIGLMKANPGDWNGTRLKQMGLIVKACVPAMQRRWLEQQLETGVAGLGGKDAAGRLNAGRMLIHAQFNDMAGKFLPKAEDARAIQDAAVRDEVLAFYSIKVETAAVEESKQPPALAEHLATLKNPASASWKVKQATTQIVRSIGRMSPQAIDSMFSNLVKDNPVVAQELVGELMSNFRSAIKGRSLDARQSNLYVLQALANSAATAKGGDAQWKQILQLMADHWVTEAELTFANRTVTQKPNVVDASDVVATAPGGKWVEALTKPMAEKVDASLARAVIAAGDFERAATLVVELSKHNKDGAVALADDFLVAWGERHDPNIPEPLRKKFGLPEDSHIAVTPVMLEKNIKNLGRIMGIFREAGVQWKDNARVVTAFDAAYGNAEAYQLSHIEAVFGSAAQMSEGLVLQMMNRMCESLGKRWRRMETQKDALTRRNEAQTLAMVRAGYSAALQIAEAWLAKNPDGYKVWTIAGTMMNDWADFEYFQQLAIGDSQERMQAFRDKQTKAQQHFAKAAEAYARVVPKMGAGEYTADHYKAWFNSLLGVNSNGDINLSKPMNRAALERMRDSIRALPGKAAEAHIGLFAKWVAGQMKSTTQPLHEELKYKFLASSLIITQNNPFTMEAQKQVEYYDELLSEIRLKTGIDGPTTVGRDQDFGVVLSVMHTEPMGRMAKFGQYLSNALPAEAAARRLREQRNPLAPRSLRMVEIQGPRDELELTIREALDPFFDIKSITFSRPDVAPRKTDQPGWQETVLAYIHLRAKDASVDRVPPVQMDLTFLDTSGPVVIPARSAEVLIKVSSTSVPPRPADKVQIVQTLDPRQFANSGALTMKVTATAVGLVPEIEDLLDLGPVKSSIKVQAVTPASGAMVKELHSWGDRISAISEREWTIVMDAGGAHEKGEAVRVDYPTAKRPEISVANQSYDDMNLVTVKGNEFVIGKPGQVPVAPGRNLTLWLIIGGGVVLAAIVLLIVLLRRRGPGEAAPVRARDVFKMPTEVDGFVVVRLLKKLQTSPLVKFEAAEQSAVGQDIQRVEAAVFAPNASGLSESELRAIAGKWLAKLS